MEPGDDVDTHPPRRDGRDPGAPQSIDVGVFAHVRFGLLWLRASLVASG